MVVVLTQVSKDERMQASIEILPDIPADDFIRQVSLPAHNALLDGPGIWADLQHVEVVIRLEHEKVGSTEVYTNGIGHVTEVSHKSDLHAFRPDRETDGIRGIVRDRKTGNLEATDGEALTGLKGLEFGCVVAPGDVWRGQPRQVHRLVNLPQQREEPRHMIAVLVRDEHSIQLFGVFGDRMEKRCELFPAQAGIDQDARAGRRNKRGVAGTAAREYADFNDRALPTKNYENVSAAWPLEELS
jgi:hypothetical protein